MADSNDSDVIEIANWERLGRCVGSALPAPVMLTGRVFGHQGYEVSEQLARSLNYVRR